MTPARTRLFMASAVLAVLLGACVAPLAWHVYRDRRYYGYVNRVRATVESFRDRRPADVPKEQWVHAVEWTSNVVCQDFFAPQPDELHSLQQLAQDLDKKAEGNVDLGTLRWVWDECEKANGGPQSYAIRFRDVKLLTQSTITDRLLPNLWSVDRCTSLDLSDTEITDASLTYLKTLTQLEAIDVRGTGITDEGARQLAEALPDCQIFH